MQTLTKESQQAYNSKPQPALHHCPSQSLLIRWPTGSKRPTLRDAEYFRPATKPFVEALEFLAAAEKSERQRILYRLIEGETIKTPAYYYQLVLRGA